MSKIKNYRRFSSRTSYSKTTFVFFRCSKLCSTVSSIDCRVSSIFACFANTTRFCTSVFRLLSFNHKIAVYFCWCFRANAMINCVFSMLSKSCRTWIRRRFDVFDTNNEYSICFISIFRSTKLSTTNSSMKQNVIRKFFNVKKRCFVRHYCLKSWLLIRLNDFILIALFILLSSRDEICWLFHHLFDYFAYRLKVFFFDCSNLFILKWSRDKKYFFVDSLWFKQSKISSITNFFFFDQFRSHFV